MSRKIIKFKLYLLYSKMYNILYLPVNCYIWAIYIISKSPLLKLQIKLNRNVLPTEDSPLLVFWYKDMFGSPFYTFDIRNGMHAASHFKNEQEGSGAVLAHLMFGEEKNPSST